MFAHGKLLIVDVDLQCELLVLVYCCVFHSSLMHQAVITVNYVGWLVIACHILQPPHK